MYTKITGIHLEITNRCNAACPVCPRNHSGGPTVAGLIPSDISLEKFQAWFSPEFIRGLENIALCGNTGDPCIARDTLEIIRWIRSINVDAEITIATNGSMRTPVWWREMAMALGENSEIAFSIDGLSDTNHIYRRGTRFDKILDNARSFIAAGGRAVWEFLVFGHNEHQVKEARDLSIEMGFANFLPKGALGFSMADGIGPIPVHDRRGNFEYFIHAPEQTEYLNPSIRGQKRAETPQVPDRIRMWDGSGMPEFDPGTWPLDPATEHQYDSTSIACKTLGNRSIFVTAYGEVVPCCWVGAGMRASAPRFEYLQLQTKLRDFGLDRINLNNRSLTGILEDPEYMATIFKDSWSCSGVRQGKMATCAQICGARSEIDGVRHL